MIPDQVEIRHEPCKGHGWSQESQESSASLPGGVVYTKVSANVRSTAAAASETEKMVATHPDGFLLRHDIPLLVAGIRDIAAVQASLEPEDQLQTSIHWRSGEGSLDSLSCQKTSITFDLNIEVVIFLLSVNLSRDLEATFYRE